MYRAGGVGRIFLPFPYVKILSPLHQSLAQGAAWSHGPHKHRRAMVCSLMTKMTTALFDAEQRAQFTFNLAQTWLVAQGYHRIATALHQTV